VAARKLQLLRYACPKISHLRPVNFHFSAIAGIALEAFAQPLKKYMTFRANTN